MLIGQTSSSWARRRMLSASRPSASTIPRAASRIRSRESPLGRVAPSAICMTYCTAYRNGRGMEGRSTARVLAWMALFGVLAFVAAWVAAGARAGVIVLALTVAALGPALRRVLPPGRATTGVTLLFVAAGAATALAAALDNGWVGLVAELLILATPFAIAAALWPAPLGAVSLSAGTTGVGIGVGLAVLGSGGAEGAADAVSLVVLGTWVAILAAGVLWATRHKPQPSALIPLRPRAFLASNWTGTGEVVLRPVFLGRLLARRFRATREATWISETVWRIDDAADFGGGRVQRRQMYCEFVAEDHVQITGGDLPEGIDVWLEQGGYRTSPFRLDFAVGPVPLLLRCHDIPYVDDDGTFGNALDVRSLLGIPLARVALRVRPLSEE